jgi:hypothetical protein
MACLQVPMYYRRKILLALLEKNNNSLERLRLQKLLFIFSMRKSNPDYHFVPFRYGCYSFQANQDLCTMIKYDMTAADDKYWHKSDTHSYYNELTVSDRALLNQVIMEFKDTSTNELIRYTYINYPYYAINSQIAHGMLNAGELAKIDAYRYKPTEKFLYTIGYEGRSLEEYLNLLIKNGMAVLCDVRRNPISMKYGFSKSQLQSACEKLNIAYYHFPDLGIASEKRQNLASDADYQRIFAEYRAGTLHENLKDQIEILNIISRQSKVAITCFEADHEHCHRNQLAISLQNNKLWNYKLIHI